MIAVSGCLKSLPHIFPLEMAENAGNMVHANAPFRIIRDVFHQKDGFEKLFGYESFTNFVNEKCTHLILTLANTLKLNDANSEKYEKFTNFLKKIERPIVVFGLGIQGELGSLDKSDLPASAKQLVVLLSEKSKLLGVRGQSTKTILEKLCGVNNIHVTGCPSVFSDIKSTYKILDALKEMRGLPAYSGTNFSSAIEKKMLLGAISSDYWLVEPVNRFNHKFYTSLFSGAALDESVPYFLKSHYSVKNGNSVEVLAQYWGRRYKLFRGMGEWLSFNKECVSFSYGSRFHVNMATLIAGKPALWVVHDERTLELTKFMNLPSVSISKFDHDGLSSLVNEKMYDEFFDNFPMLINNFKFYLQENGIDYNFFSPSFLTV